MYACVCVPPAPDQPAISADTLPRIAAEFSPRFEKHGDDLVSIDIGGLQRLLGPAAAIAEEIRRHAASCGVRVHVAVASTRMAALILSIARPGITVGRPGSEAEAMAPITLSVLEKIGDFADGLAVMRRWGIKTLGELAALPAGDLVARLGARAREWQAMARGDDLWPLVPSLPEERFESSLDLEWPIEELEPLSFVLTRLLEPLSVRLERRDRGAAVLHVVAGLVTHETYARRLELPSPMRDVRALRTLALLDLEAHPPPAAIDRVTIVIDPTPGRVLQHTLFARPHPTPEQLSTLLARLGAVMGQDRIGAAAVVDSYRPGAFAMKSFATDHDQTHQPHQTYQPHQTCTGLRRCRFPVPARVAVDSEGPVRVTTDRRGFAGGTVVHRAGPWRTSGEWWNGGKSEARSTKLEGEWNRDEWDVALSDGGMYRIFQDRETEQWFIEAIVD